MQGRLARKAIEDARGWVAKAVGVAAADVVFTSGGTEANNMVVRTAVEYGKKLGVRPHVVVSGIEHPATLAPAQHLASLGEIDLTVLRASLDEGAVSASDVAAALRPETVLVSVMLVNNETGCIADLPGIVKAVRDWESRLGPAAHRVLVHTDAAQAIGKIQVDAQALGIDYLTFTGHNVVKANEALDQACELVVKNLETYTAAMALVRSEIEKKLEATCPKHLAVVFHGRQTRNGRAPNTTNFSVVERALLESGSAKQSKLCSSRIVERLSAAGVLASRGSACHSGGVAVPSPVLVAYGIDASIAQNALRISVGRDSAVTDADAFCEALWQSCEQVLSS
ncbi:hypothetical protein HK105_206566 [Polyrhizophydium stewartii]|uniref:Selenocysteine lyase n=1 Tax=Polyrhizophydium stewartii TaxID=2732419 RepID=A0ABR4N378_9FUNG